MADKVTPFVVNDRRKFNMDGEIRPEAQTEREKETMVEVAAPVEEAPAPTPVDAEPETGDQDEEMPVVTAEQKEASQKAYDATVDRLDTAIRATNPGMEAIPAVDFSRVVQSIYMTAIMQLGGATPEGQQPQVDILGARQSIDMLGVLTEKTTNNLSEMEDRLLQNALFELRLAFLEITQAIARNASAKQGGEGTPVAGGPRIVR